MAEPKRNGNRTRRLVVDHVMAAVILALMVTPFDWGLVHEWLGIALFALFAVHQHLNRAWWRALGKGRRTARRVAGTVVDLAMVACVAGLVASSLVLSRYALAWLPALPGASWARLVHLSCSYWLFVLVYVHAGAHLRLDRGWSWRRPVLVVAFVVGTVEFARLGLPSYMTLTATFVTTDSVTPFAITVLRHVLVTCGCMSLGYVGHAWLERVDARRG